MLSSRGPTRPNLSLKKKKKKKMGVRVDLEECLHNIFGFRVAILEVCIGSNNKLKTVYWKVTRVDKNCYLEPATYNVGKFYRFPPNILITFSQTGFTFDDTATHPEPSVVRHVSSALCQKILDQRQHILVQRRERQKADNVRKAKKRYVLWSLVSSTR